MGKNPSQTVRLCEPCVRQSRDFFSWAARQRRLYIALVAASWVISSWFLAHREALLINRVDVLEQGFGRLKKQYHILELATHHEESPTNVSLSQMRNRQVSLERRLEMIEPFRENVLVRGPAKSPLVNESILQRSNTLCPGTSVPLNIDISQAHDVSIQTSHPHGHIKVCHRRQPSQQSNVRFVLDRCTSFHTWLPQQTNSTSPVLLVGATSATCALYLSTLGFKVVLFEADPRLVAYISATIRLNPLLSSHVQVVDKVVVMPPRDSVKHMLLIDTTRESVSLALDVKTVDTIASIKDFAQKAGMSAANIELRSVNVTSLVQYVLAPVSLMVVDCFGCGAHILHKLDAAMARNLPVFLFRYSPAAFRVLGYKDTPFLSIAHRNEYSIFHQKSTSIKRPNSFLKHELLCSNTRIHSLVLNNTSTELVFVSRRFANKEILRRIFAQETVPICKS
eukprot:m.70916 g.70916  ORF g.70916 m.70916 type:complete len:452 (+) comp24285_c0_seq2:180-1535(+)